MNQGSVPEKVSFRKVLVIDDDPLVAETIRAMLSDLAREVLVATDGSHALSLTAEHRFDLILCDIIMPDYNGYMIIDQLRARGIATPIVAMSGGAAGTDANDYLKWLDRRSVASTIAKPFSRRQLEEVLAAL